MTDLHYGVVLIEGRWRIIGQDLAYGSYDKLETAERAAQRLAEQSSGLSVQIHVQDEYGLLHEGERVNG